MPIGSCPPDTGMPSLRHALFDSECYTGPKAYLADSAAGGTTTRFHCDMTDAINILFNEGSGSEGGALWTMVHRDDMARAEVFLRKSKNGLFQGHPVHSQQLFITEQDVKDMREAGIRVWTFIQRQGEAVFIPAGVGHQVRICSLYVDVKLI